ncbi:MAG: cupin-like domain-containing protein [Pseudomonadota bacterium]
MSQSASRKARRAAAAKTRAAPVFTDDWRRWIAENIILGAGDEMIAARLVEKGVAPEAARAEIAAAKASPYLLGVSRAAQRLKKRDWILNIYARLDRLAADERAIERRSPPPADEFFSEYYAGHRPVILTGALDDWPAMERWSLDDLEARFPDVDVEVQMDRESRADYEIKSNQLARKAPLADVISWLRADTPTNDFYVTANNGSHNREVLSGLWDDIGPIGEYTTAPEPPTGFFWLGPRGVVTPFHHDLTNNFLVQVRGRKRVKLVPSFETPRMRNHIHCYSEWTGDDLTEDAPASSGKPRLYECVLEPGEALFIPIGWWHHVEGLDLTMGMSFTNFIWPNDFQVGYDTYKAV